MILIYTSPQVQVQTVRSKEDTNDLISLLSIDDIKEFFIYHSLIQKNLSYLQTIILFIPLTFETIQVHYVILSSHESSFCDFLHLLIISMHLCEIVAFEFFFYICIMILVFFTFKVSILRNKKDLLRLFNETFLHRL